jgi:hypothetical protein
MALVIGTGSGAASGTMVELSKVYVFKIQNPSEVENKFTVKTEKEANEIMKGVGIDDLDKLKGLLEGIDFTSVSTRQLGRLAVALYEMGYPDSGGMGFLLQGNMDCGPDGKSRNRDVKFNAIALMHEQLKGHVDFYDKEPRLKILPNSMHIIPSLICINQVVGAMAYFANALAQPVTQSEPKLGLIDERA